MELLDYWMREGRQHRLFFAQREAAESVIFLTEARADFLQGIDIPPDIPSEDRQADGYTGFRRIACKMATGTGKTTVMAMLAAWSILNKVAMRADARFSDVVLVVCPTVTIRRRLGELDPREGDASLYRTRDLVPRHLMPDLVKGRVLVTNWHVFEPQSVTPGGVSAKVSRAGVPLRTIETITIGPKTTTARGRTPTGSVAMRPMMTSTICTASPRRRTSKTGGRGSSSRCRRPTCWTWLSPRTTAG
ncbi:MAG: hypothetical protein FJZ38_02945 [Candidatus Rokubacteria bacterium]|nr:hypothetical protein [Candidatus Rokubacteria bacterium]